jgi:tripartite-type tricarboxylate transporter receptor subunit TctC
MQWNSRCGRILSAVLSVGLAVASVHAQTNANYPTRPVRMIVPFAPGGASDFVGRILQPKLSEELGQQIVIDNRAGASGNIGVELSANAPADGYTFLLGNVGTMAINPAVYLKFPVKPVRDFICVSLVVDVAGALAVHTSVPGSTFKDFVDYAKSRPGKLNYGAAAASSAQGLTMEYLKLKTGIDIQQIAYKGGAGPATTALLGGEVVASLVTTASFVPHVKSGRVKVLGVVAPRRVAALPEVPTFLELGFTELKNGSWQGVYLPLKTPQPIVKRLFTAVTKVMADPWVIERLASGGADVLTSKSPEDCAGFMKTQSEFWTKIVKQTGVTAD